MSASRLMNWRIFVCSLFALAAVYWLICYFAFHNTGSETADDDASSGDIVWGTSTYTQWPIGENFYSTFDRYPGYGLVDVFIEERSATIGEELAALNRAASKCRSVFRASFRDHKILKYSGNPPELVHARIEYIAIVFSVHKSSGRSSDVGMKGDVGFIVPAELLFADNWTPWRVGSAPARHSHPKELRVAHAGSQISYSRDLRYWIVEEHMDGGVVRPTTDE